MIEIVLIVALGISMLLNVVQVFSHNRTTTSFLSHQQEFERLTFIEQEERRRYLLLAEKAHTAQIENTGPLTPEEYDSAYGEYDDEIEREAEEEREIIAGIHGGLMRSRQLPKQDN